MNSILIITCSVTLSFLVLCADAQTKDTCLFINSVKAQEAVNKNKPTIFLWSGDVPIRYYRDSLVEAQFGFKYEDFGCIKPDSDSCLRAYSKVIFANLDKKFGKVWRRKVRGDVLFLKSIPYQRTEGSKPQ